MNSSITISIPIETKTALEKVAREEGIAIDSIVGQALKEHLFLRQFRSLRDRMTAQDGGPGVITDRDVFESVS